MQDEMKQVVLDHLGQQLHAFQEKAAELANDPTATRAMYMCTMVMANCLEDAYVKLDRMLNPYGRIGKEGLEPAPAALTLSAQDLQQIANQAARFKAIEVTLVDDGQSFQALGMINNHDDARLLYSSESVLQ